MNALSDHLSRAVSFGGARMTDDSCGSSAVGGGRSAENSNGRMRFAFVVRCASSWGGTVQAGGCRGKGKWPKGIKKSD